MWPRFGSVTVWGGTVRQVRSSVPAVPLQTGVRSGFGSWKWFWRFRFRLWFQEKRSLRESELDISNNIIGLRPLPRTQREVKITDFLKSLELILGQANWHQVSATICCCSGLLPARPYVVPYSSGREVTRTATNCGIDLVPICLSRKSVILTSLWVQGGLSHRDFRRSGLSDSYF